MQVLAERTAWDYAKQHQLDVVVINPVGGLGHATLATGMLHWSMCSGCILVADQLECRSQAFVLGPALSATATAAVVQTFAVRL